MNVFNIIAAPKTKRAIFYDPITKQTRSERADVIGVVEFLNPDDSDQAVSLACYLCTDKAGFYQTPQMCPDFLDLIDENEVLDLGNYTQQIAIITDIYRQIDEELTGIETVQVKHEGKVSFIKRNLKKPIKPEDKK